MSIVLHIGLEKTGTKAIQYWLRDHEDLLAQHGLRFPRGWLRLNVHQELPLTIMRLDRLCSPRELGNEWRWPEWRLHVMHQITRDLDRHKDLTTVLSSENLDLLRFDDEFEMLRYLVGDAQIVVYLRNPERWLASLRLQYTMKNGPGRTLSSNPEDYNYLDPDTWRVDYHTLLEGWRRWFSQITVYSYDQLSAQEGSVLPSFLRHLNLPIIDVDERYNLNTATQPTPRAEGNRWTNGLHFGEVPAVDPAQQPQ